MAYLEWLEQTLTEKLAEEPIGRPVALRAYLQLTHDHGRLIPVLAAATAAAQRWLSADVPRIYAQGGVSDGALSILAAFPNGATAMISSELARPQPDGCGEPLAITLLLVGNRGTMQFRHTAAIDETLDETASDRLRNRELEALIETSLREGDFAIP